MGTLYSDNFQKTAFATYDDGVVYEGGSTHNRILGTYRDGYIYNAHREAIAKFKNNSAYELSALFDVGNALCVSSGNTIYKGSSTWNPWIAVFEGDSFGACAAAVLSFDLHHKKEPVSTESNSHTPAENGSVDFGSFVGILIAAVIAVAATYLFYFTPNGNALLFHDSMGIFNFVVCIMTGIIGSCVIYKKKSIKKLGTIAAAASLSYSVASLIIFIYGLVEAILSKTLNFGNFFMLFFGALIAVVGISIPICAIQIIILYVLKKLFCKN